MKPTKLILVVSALLLIAGWTLVAFSKGRYATEIGAWLWVAAFVVISLPLLLWIAHLIFRRKDRG